MHLHYDDGGNCRTVSLSTLIGLDATDTAEGFLLQLSLGVNNGARLELLGLGKPPAAKPPVTTTSASSAGAPPVATAAASAAGVVASSLPALSVTPGDTRLLGLVGELRAALDGGRLRVRFCPRCSQSWYALTVTAAVEKAAADTTVRIYRRVGRDASQHALVTTLRPRAAAPRPSFSFAFALLESDTRRVALQGRVQHAESRRDWSCASAPYVNASVSTSLSYPANREAPGTEARPTCTHEYRLQARSDDVDHPPLTLSVRSSISGQSTVRP